MADSERTTVQVTSRAKRAQLQRAQQLALDGEWEEAIALNQEILAATPGDVSALNRLGKALSELRRYREAFAVYAQALERDPANQIARRNLNRHEPLTDQGGEAAAAERPRAQARHSMFIEEVGKTRVMELDDLAPNERLLEMSSGDQVDLRVEGEQIAVYSEDGVHLGRLPLRYARRLLPLIAGGNRYGAAVTAVEPGMMRVIVREIYQHPSQYGKLSFTTEERPLLPRPYLRETTRTRFLGDEADFLPSDEEDEETEDEGDRDEDEEGFAEDEEEGTLDEGEEEQPS
jgi:hypothetical protein